MFDNIIVSSDEHFKGFFPIVRQAWRKFFPEINVYAAFVTTRTEDDEFVIELKNSYDKVQLFEPIDGIPNKNVAKMSRFLMASSLGDEISSIEDVDTIPLQREYFEKKISLRKKNKILAVGQEVYGEGAYPRFPVSTITSEGVNFKKIFNPEDLNYSDLFSFWKRIHPKITAFNFSDEELISDLITRLEVDNVQHISRDVDPKKDWIDRSWWNINVEKLNNGDYVTCNFHRPFESHVDSFGPIINYING